MNTFKDRALKLRIVISLILGLFLSLAGMSQNNNSFQLADPASESPFNTSNYMKFYKITYGRSRDSLRSPDQDYTRGYVNFGDGQTPAQMLHVQGGNILLSTGDGHNPCSHNGSILFGYQDQTISQPNYAGNWGIEYWTSGGSNGLNFWKPYYPSTEGSGNYKLFLRDDGNIGIGTGEPRTALHVMGDVTVSNLANDGSNLVSTDATGKFVKIPKSSIVGDNMGDCNATHNISLQGHLITNINNEGEEGLRFLRNSEGEMNLVSRGNATFLLTSISKGDDLGNAMFWAANTTSKGYGFGLTKDDGLGGIFWGIEDRQRRIMTFSEDQVGIGPEQPRAKLDVQGGMIVSDLVNTNDNNVVSTDGVGRLKLVSKSSLGDNLGNHTAEQNLKMSDFSIMNGGPGTPQKITRPDGSTFNPGLWFPDNNKMNFETGNEAKISIVSSQDKESSLWVANWGFGGFGLVTHAGRFKGGIYFKDYTGPVSVMNFNGSKVGLGYDPPFDGKFNLYVANGILTEEVKVELKNNGPDWPDYVFGKGYRLQSLKEVGSFVDKHKHLPEMPSAETVKKEGINLGEMNAMLLKKIEELTLYLIDQQKQIDELKKAIKN